MRIIVRPPVVPWDLGSPALNTTGETDENWLKNYQPILLSVASTLFICKRNMVPFFSLKLVSNGGVFERSTLIVRLFYVTRFKT